MDDPWEALCKGLKLLGTSGLGQKYEYDWDCLLPTGLGARSPCSYFLPLPSSCCTASFGVPRRDYKCFPSQQHALTESNTVQSNFRTTPVKRKEQRSPAYSSSSMFIVSSVSMLCSPPSSTLTSADDSALVCSKQLRRIVYTRVHSSCCPSVSLGKCIATCLTIEGIDIALKSRAFPI